MQRTFRGLCRLTSALELQAGARIPHGNPEERSPDCQFQVAVRWHSLDSPRPAPILNNVILTRTFKTPPPQS
jgi:hypothetical protein